MGPDPDTRPRGLFVVLDGIDGCGKSTQAARLVEGLRELRGAAGGASAGPGPLHLREPGSTDAGERIRALVLGAEPRLGRGALALLFAAARREMLEQCVAPALEGGRDVVVERFHASTYAYQGARQAGSDGPHAAPFDDGELLGLLRTWAGRPAPALEVVLDLDPSVATDRALERADGAARDRFEREGLAFQERVREGLREYVERTSSAVVVDATGSVDEVAERVLGAVRAHLAAEGARA